MKQNLDALLGMDVRTPGTAATLPAVIRITETLEPAGGKDFPVFPPSYAAEGTNAPPVYDLNGIEWGEVLRERSARDGTKRITRYIKSARHCTMDSPQSHANPQRSPFSMILVSAPSSRRRKPGSRESSNLPIWETPVCSRFRIVLPTSVSAPPIRRRKRERQSGTSPRAMRSRFYD